MTELTAGMEAPDFTLESDAGTPVSLSACAATASCSISIRKTTLAVVQQKRAVYGTVIRNCKLLATK